VKSFCYNIIGNEETFKVVSDPSGKILIEGVRRGRLRERVLWQNRMAAVDNKEGGVPCYAVD